MEISKNPIECLKRSVMAGVAIGIGGFAYLAVGGVAGSVLFSFGLITVYTYSLFLFTGLAGNLPGKQIIPDLLYVLIGNIAGAILVALLARLSPLGVQEAATNVFLSRVSIGWWKAGLLSILCGFIVDEAVYGAKKGTLVPTFLGVSVFVLCGFPHCIADAFYYALTPVGVLSENIGSLGGVYVSIVLGNFIGCNVARVLKLK